MTVQPGKRRIVASILLAWIIFLGIDFFFHASLFSTFWETGAPAFIDERLLFQRIPYGYASFLVLVILEFYLLTRIHGSEPRSGPALTFGVVFGGLFSVSMFLGWYSFLAIPALHLLAFSLVYFIELAVVSWLLAVLLRRMKATTILATLGVFLGLVIAGVLIQNM